MAGYSWINQMDFTHPGTVAIGSYQNASKQRGEKKAREMQFAKDQKMLDKLTLEIAHLPEKHAMDMQQAEHKILVDQLTAALKQQEYAYNPQKWAQESQLNQAKIGTQGAMQEKYFAEAYKNAMLGDKATRPLGTSTQFGSQIEGMLKSGIPTLELEGRALIEENKGNVEGANMFREEARKRKELDRQKMLQQKWTSTPDVTQKEIVSELNGIVLDVTEANRLAQQDLTKEQVGAMHGIPKEKLHLYPALDSPTEATKTHIQKVESEDAAAANLGKFMVKATAPYFGHDFSGILGNRSAKLLKDQLTGQNEDAQSDVIAAWMIYPLWKAATLGSTGMSMSEGALEKIMQSGFKNIEPLQLPVNSSLYQKSMAKYEKVMHDTSRIYSSTSLNRVGKRKQEYEERDAEKANKIISEEEKKEIPKFGLSTKAEGPLGIFRSSKQ